MTTRVAPPPPPMPPPPLPPPPPHRFYLFLGTHGGPRDGSHLLIEMAVRRVQSLEGLRGTYPLVTMHDGEAAKQGALHHGAACLKQLLAVSNPDFIIVEWMRMQNPNITSLSLFPGQEHASLGGLLGLLEGRVGMSTSKVWGLRAGWA